MTGVGSIARDITSAKRLEEERVRLAAIVAASRDAIISTSHDGVILSWNAGAERVYGYTSDEAVGQSIAMLFAPGDRCNTTRIG